MAGLAEKPSYRKAFALHVPVQLCAFPFSKIGEGPPYFKGTQAPLQRVIQQQLRLTVRFFHAPAPTRLHRVLASNYFLWQVAQHTALRKAWKFFVRKAGNRLECQPWVFTWGNPVTAAWQAQLFAVWMAPLLPHNHFAHPNFTEGSAFLRRLGYRKNGRHKNRRQCYFKASENTPHTTNHLQQDAFQAWNQVWEGQQTNPQLLAMLDYSLFKAMDTTTNPLSAFDAYINYRNVLEDMKKQNGCHPREP